MRVLFWGELFWPYVGGPEQLSMRLLPALRELGHEFIVITSHHDRALPDRDSLDGIPIYRFPFRDALHRRDAKALTATRERVADVVTSFSPAMVHMGAFGPSALVYLMTPAARTMPLLATVQHQLLPASHGPNSLLGRLLDASSWVRTVSRSVLLELRERKPELATRSSVIYSFVESTEPASAAPAPFESPVVLCLGRLIADKGFDVAIRAFGDVLEAFPNARLVVAGDGVCRDALQTLAATAGISGRVTFSGWVEPGAVRDMMNRATLVLLPSRREGLPMVAIQAAFAQRPIVAANVGGMSEVVLHGRTGLLAPPGDEDALARAVCALLRDPERARGLAAAARAHALERFSKARCVASFDGLYRRLSPTPAKA
jgi:glycogen(starch) synthase